MFTRRRIPFFVTATSLVAAVLTLSCLDQAGPGPSLMGRFAVRPVFGSAGIVPLARARLTLQRNADQSVVLDTLVDIEPADSTVDLSVAVELRNAAETFLLVIRLIGPAGDTVFRGGPVSVSPGPASGNVPVIDLPFTYEGVGKDAQSVTILTSDFIVFPGDTILFDAAALDSLDQPLDGTPIEWSSLDAQVATAATLAPPDYRGRIVGVSPGTVRIVARLLTNKADTTSFPVVSRAAGEIWSTGNDGTEAVTIDKVTGAGTLVGRFGTTQTWAAAFDPNGTLYTLVNGFSGNAILATVDQTTGTATTIGQGVGGSMISLEFDAAGTLYGIGYDDQVLYRIDKALGTAVAIGPTGIAANMDLAFNSAGTMYATTGNQIWTVNPATGATTSLGIVSGVCPGGEIMGIMFDAADVLYATNYADATTSCLMVVNLGTMTATSLGLTGQFRPHGGDMK
jgi:hypothetical protein